MRVGDGPLGAAFLGLAVAVLWHIKDFPPAPGQPHGPALFPGLIAVGLAGAAVLLIISSLRGHAARGVAPGAAAGVAAVARDGASSDAEGDATDRAAPDTGGWLAFGVTIFALIGYVLVVDHLGFIPTAFLMLCALLAAYRVRIGLIVPVAAISTLLVHFSFYKLLKVPLPWGLLSAIAW